MTAIQPLSRLIGINLQKFSKEENRLLEAELFTRICEELKEIFRDQHKEYFQLMKFSIEREDTMLDANFTRLLIKEILKTEAYTLEGIAKYVDMHDDVIHEVVSGLNPYPSAFFVRRIIELHKEVRQDLYQTIIKKITTEYLAVA